jgi:HSP20 family protein
MVDTNLRTDTLRPNWHAPEEVQYLTPDGLRWRIVSKPLVWRPPTDVFETDETIIVRVEIAGLREEDIVISLEGQLLAVRGTRFDTAEKRAYYQMEIPFGEFSTEIELPSSILADQVQASYRDGFLRITLPKAQPRHIKIKD